MGGLRKKVFHFVFGYVSQREENPGDPYLKERMKEKGGGGGNKKKKKKTKKKTT